MDRANGLALIILVRAFVTVETSSSFVGRVTRRRLLPARSLQLLCLLLTPLFPPSSLPTRLLPVKDGTRGAEASPDNDINFPRTSAPFTLDPEPVGFAMWRCFAPDPKPFTMFLFVAPRVCLRLLSDPASRRNRRGQSLLFDIIPLRLLQLARPQFKKCQTVRIDPFCCLRIGRGLKVSANGGQGMLL